MGRFFTWADLKRDPLYKKGFQIGKEEARRELEDEAAREIAANLLRKTDMTPKEIATLLGLSLRVVQNIKAKISR